MFQDLCDDTFYHFIIIEEPTGESLGDYVMKNGPLSDENTVNLIKDLINVFTDLSDLIQSELYLTQDQVFVDENGRLTKVIPLTFQNTPDYHFFAPEIIWGNNNSNSIATWVLGVIAYFAYVGTLPFSGETPEELNENILSGTLVFPSSASDKIRALISRMLLKNHILRDPIDTFQFSFLKDIEPSQHRKVKKAMSAADIEFKGIDLVKNTRPKRKSFESSDRTQLSVCLTPVNIRSRKRSFVLI